MSIDTFQSKVTVLLKNAETELKAAFGDVNIGFSIQPHRLGTQIVLSALFKDNPDLFCDLVELIVSLQDIPSPVVNAEVTWGHPWCHEDAAYSDDPVEITPENLQHVYDDLPRLIGVFEAAVRRGNCLFYQWYQSAFSNSRAEGISLTYVDSESPRGCWIDLENPSFVGKITFWPENDFEFQFDDKRSGKVALLESKTFHTLGELVIFADEQIQNILRR